MELQKYKRLEVEPNVQTGKPSAVKAVEQGVLHEEDSDEDRSRKYLLLNYLLHIYRADRWETSAI